MKLHTTTSARVLRAARWPAIATLSAGALICAQWVNAAPPPAGTTIGNQASATYVDNGGTSRTAQSAMVTTTVTQVGSFTLDSNGAQTGAAGQTLYVPHAITNTGNGSDSFTIGVVEANLGTAPDFTKIEVFADADGDNRPDGPALCSITAATSTCSVPAQSASGNGGQFRFVIGYTIPPTAVVGTWPSNAATVTVTTTNPAIYTGATTASLTDTITLTSGAAFTMSKAILAPAASRPSGTWPVATSGVRGTQTTYTLTYTNTGAAAAPLYIKDVLPVGLTYIANSAVWSGASGVALTDAAGGDTAGIDFQSVTASGTTTIEALVGTVAPGVTGTVSFVVQASATAAVGTTDTTNRAQYSAVGCGASTTVAGATCTGSLTNTGNSPFTVLQGYGVVFGVNSTTPVVDITPGTPNPTGDTATVASATPGASVKFDLYVQNTGNGPDVFDLSLPTIGGAGQFPAGTTFSWFGADGITPLLDSNGNGTVDTGVIAATAIQHVVLQVNLPSGLTLSPTANYVGNVVATSAGDTTKKDAAAVKVTAIVGSALDLSHTGVVGDPDLGPGPSAAASLTKSAAAGDTTSYAIYPLVIQNNGSVAATTTSLFASQTTAFPGSLPSGVTVTFSTSATCAAGNNAPSTLPSIAAGASATYYACVQAGTAVPLGTYQLYFRASDTTLSVADTLHDALTVVSATSYRYTATPNNTNQSVPGGFVEFSHTVANTGTQACGVSGFTVNVTGLPSGWAAPSLYIDNNGDGHVDGGDTLIDNTASKLGTLAAGASAKIVVKLFVPAGATSGTVGTATVQVREVAAAGPTTCVQQGADPVDTVTVQDAQVTVDKTQALDAACDGTADTAFSGNTFTVRPGQCVIYKVVATNAGASVVTNLSVSDAVPPYTTYTTGGGGSQPGTQCASSGVTGTAVAFASAGSPVASVSCGSATNSVAASGTGSVTLTYSVKVNN